MANVLGRADDHGVGAGLRCDRGELDRRSVLIELTPAGRAAFDQARPDLLATEAALLGGLAPRDRTALASLLAKLAASLEQGQDPPESP